MNFSDIHIRLTEHIALKVRRGDLTERALAKRVGISQPHLHNVLKGKRCFSLETADLVMEALDMTILDLIRDPAGSLSP